MYEKLWALRQHAFFKIGAAWRNYLLAIKMTFRYGAHIGFLMVRPAANRALTRSYNYQTCKDNSLAMKVAFSGKFHDA